MKDEGPNALTPLPEDERAIVSAGRGEILLYQTEDGRTRVECRFQDETIWLSQAMMAELYQKDVRTINDHLKNIYDEGELEPGATIRQYRIVRREGSRQVARQIEHYSLDAILAVGYRVRSPRGTQFRRWATERLREYLVKGFVLDDERLKNPPSPSLGVPDYFDEMLERIRDIRANQRVNFEIRNSKSQTSSNDRNPKCKTGLGPASRFDHSNFGLVSNFGFRASDFRRVAGRSRKLKASRTRSRPLKTQPGTCQPERKAIKKWVTVNSLTSMTATNCWRRKRVTVHSNDTGKNSEGKTLDEESKTDHQKDRWISQRPR